jgi:predicted acylesterase/phospholipase RssA
VFSFVCTRAAQAASGVTARKFRTYDTGDVGQEEDLQIWQAGRATSAAPTFFKRMRIGLVDFIDGGIGFNNPAQTLLDEMYELYGDRPIACIISVGAGVATIKSYSEPKGWQKLIPKDLIDVFAEMVTDCEKTAHELEVKFSHTPQVYNRFSVQRGLESIGMEEWEKLAEVEAKTVEYLQLDKNRNEVRAAAKALSAPVASGLKASDLRN